MLNPVPKSSCLFDPVNSSIRVLLRIMPVTISNGEEKLETYVIQDDGSERTIILTPAVETRNLRKKARKYCPSYQSS